MSKTAKEVIELYVDGFKNEMKPAMYGLVSAIDAAGFVIVPKQKDKWVDRERATTIAALRSLCAEFGDNDWPDDLHLADVVEKHLGKHLHVSARETKP